MSDEKKVTLASLQTTDNLRVAVAKAFIALCANPKSTVQDLEKVAMALFQHRDSVDSVSDAVTAFRSKLNEARKSAAKAGKSGRIPPMPERLCKPGGSRGSDWSWL